MFIILQHFLNTCIGSKDIMLIHLFIETSDIQKAIGICQVVMPWWFTHQSLSQEICFLGNLGIYIAVWGDCLCISWMGQTGRKLSGSTAALWPHLVKKKKKRELACSLACTTNTTSVFWEVWLEIIVFSSFLNVTKSNGCTTYLF